MVEVHAKIHVYYLKPMKNLYNKKLKRSGKMRKGLQNPNSLAAVKELQMEIAEELGIQDLDKVRKDKSDMRNEVINRKLVEKARFNLIGFK